MMSGLGRRRAKKIKKQSKKKKSGNEREESCQGVGWHGFDNTQNVGPIS